MPRASSKTCGYSRAISSSSRAQLAALALAPRPGSPGASMTSSTALPAAQASGLPPKVVPCVPGTSALANCSFASTAPSGKPPPMPFADDMTSGVMPAHSCANSLPVRPMPDCTSSMPRIRPYSSHTARRSRRNCMSAGRTPPSPWIGSTMMPAGRRADRVAHRVHVVERHVVEAFDHRAEAFQVVRVAGGGERGQRAAVERALEADEAEAFRLAAVRHRAAHHLDHALVRLGARVAEEHAVRERRIDQPLPPGVRPAECGRGWTRASPWRPARRSSAPDADGRGRARRWRCRSRNRGIVARPPSTARRPRPARKRGRHGRSSAAERRSWGLLTLSG